MDLGSAIKALRKQKKITQKDLAALCEMSTNALCNIEKNQSFPPKATISKICQALDIPTAYLLLFSITDEDVPEEKQMVFKSLSNPLKEVLLESVTK